MKMNVTNMEKYFLLALSMIGVLTVNAQDDDTNKKPQDGKKSWYFQPGAIFVSFDESAELNAAGNPVPDASLNLSNSTLPGVQVGYHLSDNISLSTVVTVPVKTTATGTGAVAGITVGEATIIPLDLIGNYHFYLGGFQPFFGAGINYTIISQIEDANVLNIEADNTFGFVLRGGFDFMFSKNWGFNASVLYHFITTDLSGTLDPAIPGLGGAPITSEVQINPLAVQVGITYKL